MNAILALIINP